MAGGMGGGGGEVDVTNAVNQISEMVQAGLQFAEHQTQQGMRFGEQKTEQAIRFGEDQLEKGIQYAEPRAEQAMSELKTGIETGKAEIREGYAKYQALNTPYRLAAYNALDSTLDILGMPRFNVSSADLAKSMEAKAAMTGAQDRLRASGIGLLSQLPEGLPPEIRRNLEYAVMSGANPQTVSSQLKQVMSGLGLNWDINRDRSATQFERFKFSNSGVNVPRLGPDGQPMGGSGSGGSSYLNPTTGGTFNSPEYLNPAQRSTVGDPNRNTMIFNPLDSYMSNSLAAYQDLYRSQMSMPYNQQGLSAALQNGSMSQPPRVVDVF